MATRPYSIETSSPYPIDKGADFTLSTLEDISQGAIDMFLEYYEELNVELAQKLVNTRYRLLYNVRVIAQEGIIAGVLSLSKGNVLLYMLPQELYCPKIKKLVIEYLMSKDISCISCSLGTRWGGRLIENISWKLFQKRPYDTRKMLLYMYDCRSQHTTLKQSLGVTIKHCSEVDIDSLYPLREGFEREEMLPQGETFNKELCIKRIQCELKLGEIYGLQMEEDENNLVACLSIRARASRLVLIGGVYTLPEYRGKGFASYITRTVAQITLNQGATSLLYVNRSNTQAIMAYTKAGFVLIDDWLLNYY